MKITRRQLRQIIRTTLNEAFPLMDEYGSNAQDPRDWDWVFLDDLSVEDVTAALIKSVEMDPDMGDHLKKLEDATGVSLSSKDDINSLKEFNSDYDTIIKFLDKPLPVTSNEISWTAEEKLRGEINLGIMTGFLMTKSSSEIEAMPLRSFEEPEEPEEPTRPSRVRIEWVPDDGTDKTIEWLKNEMIYDKEILPWLEAVSSIESFDDCDDADDFDRCVNDKITAATGVVWFDYEDQLMGQEEKTTWPQIARHILQKIK